MNNSENYIKSGKEKSFRKNKIVFGIRNVKEKNEKECPFLEESIVKDCGSCNLKMICEEIDERLEI